MKAFIYNLLSKGLLILVLLALVAGYYYRTTLFPQFFAAEDVVQVTPAAAESSAPHASSADATAEQPAAVDIPPVTTDSTPVQSEPVSETAAVQWPEPQAAFEDTQPTPLPAGLPESSDDPLAQARSAYWTGAVDDAIAAYRALAEQRPSDPDVQGELGNILFAQGDLTGAADAYLAAGRALISKRRMAPAQHLVAVLQGLNPEHATTLADELTQQQGESRP